MARTSEGGLFSDERNLGVDKPGYERVDLSFPRERVHELDQNPLCRDFLITCAGFYDQALGHQADRRGVSLFPDYVLHFCVGGRGYQEVGGFRIEVGCGEIAVCPPDKPHRYGSSKQAPWSVYWAGFRGQQARPLMEALGLREDAPSLYVGKDSRDVEQFYRVFEAMRRGCGVYEALHASQLLKCLLTGWIARRQSIRGQRISGLDIQQIIEMMARNLNRAVSLQDFAGYVGLSKDYFNECFQRATGYSAMQYFGRMKLMRACELLTGSALSVQQISAELAFCNPYYFSTRFKQMFGMSPRQYRQRFAGVKMEERR